MIPHGDDSRQITIIRHRRALRLGLPRIVRQTLLHAVLKSVHRRVRQIRDLLAVRGGRAVGPVGEAVFREGGVVRGVVGVRRGEGAGVVG